ncbi:MAG: hypothetical protein MRY83_01730, partial [Flavobacteriales bacterium]|nr:hypothetical protein [Flavobacteriales bacterium]
MKKILPIFVFTAIALNLNGQDYDPRIYKVENAHKLIRKADSYFYHQDYDEAVKIYNWLKDNLPEYHDYYEYKAALCYEYSNTSTDVSLDYLLEVDSSLANSEVANMYYYHLGHAYHINGRYKEAISSFEKARDSELSVEDDFLREECEYHIKAAKNAIEITANRDNTIKIIDLTDKVNSQYSEYKPVISADGNTLIFTSDRSETTGGKKDVDGKFFEDIYISEKDEYGYWQKSRGISKKINTDDHEACVGLSPDGRRLLIYLGWKGGGGIYQSFLEGDDWSDPFPIDVHHTINSRKYWENSASISADERFLYFSSDRKGSLGGLDIYVAEKLPTGEWGEPKSLGNKVNSKYDEDAPFIHPDGKTLYFASKGHNTMGGFDIYKSTLVNGQWSDPVNMGSPINSEFDDLHFVLTADGKKGFFSSFRAGGKGKADLYKVILEEDVSALTLISGVVKTETGDKPQVSIMVKDKINGKQQKYVYSPNRETGKYLMILPPGQSYEMLVSAEGYDPAVVDVDVPKLSEYKELYQEIILHKPRPGDASAKNVTVINSFNKDTSLAIADTAFHHPSAEKVSELVNELVTLTDQTGSTNLADNAALEEKVNEAEKLTEEVTQNLEEIARAEEERKAKEAEEAKAKAEQDALALAEAEKNAKEAEAAKIKAEAEAAKAKAEQDALA